MAITSYSLNDPEFKRRLIEIIRSGGLVEGHMIEQSGRRTPGVIEELTDEADPRHLFFLSNDSRWNNSNRGSQRKNTRAMAYSHSVDFHNGASIVFEGEFDTMLKIEEDARFLGIDHNGKAGTFKDKEAIGEYLTKNPGTKLRFYEITKELKPEIKVSFGD